MVFYRKHIQSYSISIYRCFTVKLGIGQEHLRALAILDHFSIFILTHFVPYFAILHSCRQLLVKTSNALNCSQSPPIKKNYSLTKSCNSRKLRAIVIILDIVVLEISELFKWTKFCSLNFRTVVTLVTLMLDWHWFLWLIFIT